ncbi:hypothetical protein DRQ33_05900 [bacterium]|nr:MAG: hypothetical protein DRQ33_05900 [bacterium]
MMEWRKISSSMILFVVIVPLLCWGQSDLDERIMADSLELMEEIGIEDQRLQFEEQTGLLLVEGIDGRETGEYIFRSGKPNEVVHAGCYVFIANESSIEILSIADPENPQHLLSYPATNAMGIAIQSGLIFITSKTHGLDIYSYDVENNQLEHISNFHHDSRVQYRYVAVSGCYAYISCVSVIINSNGLEVVNIKDVTNPQHEVFVPGGKLNKDLVVSGTRVFMAGAFYGVHIFDMEEYFSSGGAVKVTTLTYKPSHGKMNCYDVDIDGSLLYVADYYNGLEIFNWRSKNPWLGECYDEVTGNPTGVACDGDWAYMTTLTETGGYLYVIDVQYPDFGMKPYAAYDNSYGAVSPDPVGTKVEFVSGREAPLASYTIEKIAESLADMITPEWIGHTEITPPAPIDQMFGGWIVIEGNYAYVMGRGYTVTKYDITDPTSPDEIATTSDIDEGYSAEIYGDYIYVAGKRGVWKINTGDLSIVDTNEASPIWGQIMLYPPNYAFVFGMNTPQSSVVRKICAAYNIAGDGITFLDSVSSIWDPYEPDNDPAYQDNWYYFGLLPYIFAGSDNLYQHLNVSTRSEEWWNPTGTHVPFIVHSGRFHYNTIFEISSNHFDTYYGLIPHGDYGMWASGDVEDISGIDNSYQKFDVNWHFSPEGGDFLSLWHDWSDDNQHWYTYGPEPYESDSIRTHFMDRSGNNHYWAVWDEQGITNSDRFPLWYAQSSDWHMSSFTRIDSLTPSDSSWGDFFTMNVIHFAINGPDKLFLITKRTGEIHYYIDVIRVADMLCAGELAKRNINQNLKVPKTSKITISPNPFNTRCQIKIELPKDEQVNLEIYDINGKNIYSKNFGELCEGLHNFNWNGETEYGEPLPSGIYFIKIKIGTKNKITKVILLK